MKSDILAAPVSAELHSFETVSGQHRARAKLPESIGGIIAAVVVFASCAHFFITPYLWITPPLPVSRDSSSLPFHVVKQVMEGISSARITDTGARHTGDFLPGAPVYVAMGDSHVLARNVNDDEAMGAVAQRLARLAGDRINIREIGRSGGVPADYAVEAPAVLGVWNPVLVFVVLSQRDFELPLNRTRLGTIERTDRGVRIVANPPHVDSRAKILFWKVRNLGTLPEVLLSNPVGLYDVFRDNSWRSTGSDPAPAEPAVDRGEVETAVAGLKQAYGQRLVLVYHAEIGLTGGETPDARENALAAAASRNGVRLLSLRAALIAERERNHHFPNGFLNGRPGVGHLNAYGHRVAGEALWDCIARDRGR